MISCKTSILYIFLNKLNKMTDNITQNISIALYRYLCLNTVETVDHVKTTRLMNAVMDHLSSNCDIAHIMSGSFGEGLEMRGSDLDKMGVTKRIEVYEFVEPRFNPYMAYFSMDTDDVKPGFTQLRLQSGRQYVLQWCEKCHGKYYFSSTIFKQKLLCNKRLKIHGPCISDNNGSYDIASCFHCKTWISPAIHWISRSHNSWPSLSVKQSIIKHGVLFVPIGVKGSVKEDLEWRISFSVGEKLLINTFTHTQLLCYALLKILLKDVISTYSECKELLCSYFLKTILFWISEELPQSAWKPDQLIPRFMQCFSRLIYCVEYSVCLHYFIPKNNMFENKIEGRGREVLLEKLNTLHSYGWRCILFSDQVSNFPASMRYINMPHHRLFVNEVRKRNNSMLLYKANSCFRRMFFMNNVLSYSSYIKGIHKTVACDKSSIKYLYIYYMSIICSVRGQSIPLNSASICNKYQYRQYKSCLSTLLQNIYHDAVSGWLMLASLFYKTKQYAESLRIIRYSLSKCTSEKLYKFMNMSDIHYRLFKLKSLQKKSIVQLWKFILVDFMKIEQYSVLIPDELLIDMEMLEGGILVIPSSAYAYYLSFLCHYHLNNIRQCLDTVQNLQLVIKENYLIPDLGLKAAACNLLGVALQKLGDTQSARQAFMQSVKLDPNPSVNPAVKRLLLMS